jgi:hypothetical protein
MKFLIIFFILILSFNSSLNADFDDDYSSSYSEDFLHDESTDDKWQEKKYQIPTISEKNKLTKINVEKAPNFDVYIDQKTLVINKNDNVTRLWVSFISNRNSTNNQFIGMRCETSEYKIYAYQTKKGIKLLKNPKWKNLQLYYREIADDYLCLVNNEGYIID